MLVLVPFGHVLFLSLREGYGLHTQSAGYGNDAPYLSLFFSVPQKIDLSIHINTYCSTPLSFFSSPSPARSLSLSPWSSLSAFSVWSSTVTVTMVLVSPWPLLHLHPSSSLFLLSMVVLELWVYLRNKVFTTTTNASMICVDDKDVVYNGGCCYECQCVSPLKK